MSTLLHDHPVVKEAYEKYRQFNSDKELRALDEAHQKFLHDQATKVEVARTEEKIESRIAMIFMFLADRFDGITKELEEKVQRITDIEKLNELVKFAAKCKDLSEFEKALDYHSILKARKKRQIHCKIIRHIKKHKSHKLI